MTHPYFITVNQGHPSTCTHACTSTAKAVIAYLKSEQSLPLGFARQPREKATKVKWEGAIKGDYQKGPCVTDI